MNIKTKSCLPELRRRLLSGSIALCLALCTQLQGASVTVNGFKYSDPAFETIIGVDLAGVAGVTGVEAVAAGGATMPLAAFFADQYVATFGPYASFASFLASTTGAWRLRIHFGASGSAVYDFPVSGFGSPGADPFPPVPTMISPVDGAAGVSPTPTFIWNNGGTHSGALEALFVNVYSLVDSSVGQFENSFGSIGLNDTMWTPSVVLPAGAAMFLVQYETNQNEDARVGAPVFNGAASSVGDPLISWDDHSGDLFSRDLISFTVTPLEIVAVARSGGSVKIGIAAPLGMRVGVEYSPNLGNRTWALLGEVAMSGGSGTFVDADPVRQRHSEGFYRAVELPAPF